MKKFLSIIVIQAICILNISYADSSIDGEITPITIPPVFELKLASWTMDGKNNVQVGDPRTNGNLIFGPTDITADGITADQSASGATAYKKTPHRVNQYYNHVQFWVSNNTYENYKITVTVSGTLFSNITAPLPGESIMHMIGYDIPDGTQYHDNIKILETTKLLNEVSTLIYADTDPGILYGEGFETVIAIDFLPVNLIKGNYEGQITYDLISGL